jgi:hypothetical protein
VTQQRRTADMRPARIAIWGSYALAMALPLVFALALFLALVEHARSAEPGDELVGRAVGLASFCELTDENLASMREIHRTEDADVYVALMRDPASMCYNARIAGVQYPPVRIDGVLERPRFGDRCYVYWTFAYGSKRGFTWGQMPDGACGRGA